MKDIEAYIAELSVGTRSAGSRTVRVEDAISIDSLPDAVVSGSQLIAFEEGVSLDLKSGTTLSLLVAQRVAANHPDLKVASEEDAPAVWLKIHNDVLGRLGWLFESGSDVAFETSGTGVEIHTELLPFIESVLGVNAAASIISKTIKSLESLGSKPSWFKLWEDEGKRFKINEFRFSTVEESDGGLKMKIARAHFAASQDTTKFLFFKTGQSEATFTSASASLVGTSDTLKAANSALKSKMKEQTQTYIAAIPDEFLK